MIDPSVLARRVTVTGSVIAAVSAAVTIANAVTMRMLTRPTRDVAESIAVCVPARNEAPRLPALIADLRAQTHCSALTIVIVDDGSSDGTFDAARIAAGSDPRITVIRTTDEPPAGWTGKAAACRTLAELASAVSPTHIAFVDADVRLDAGAIAAASTALTFADAALVCPWPRQLTGSIIESVVQPLLRFSWMSTLPVAAANASTLSSTVVACGQFMMFDFASYQAVGGHAAVAASVTEDLDIARVLRRHGDRTVLVSGGGLVRCRMYDGWPSLRDGYTRWLWSAFGGLSGSAAVATIASVAYLVPPFAAAFGSGSIRRSGLLGYGAGVVARMVSERADSGSDVSWARTAASSCAHPVSVALYLGLTAQSFRRRRAGTTTWKNRQL